MTPEEIVGLIGNIGNRPDLREVQARQVKLIKELVEKERADCAQLADISSRGWYKTGEEKAGIACSNIAWYIEKRGKSE